VSVFAVFFSRILAFHIRAPIRRASG
jgi:hypothetical protein